MDNDYLRLENVSKSFDTMPAVRNVSLRIPRGTFTTLLGPSGCGKTTLLRLIAGFYDADEGRIFLDRQQLNDLPPHKRRTAMVFQDYALFPHMRVYDNVAYGLRLAGVEHKELQRRVFETLEFVGLSEFAERHPGALSGGQQQRVALARALVIRPKVILLDEPLSNLDANLRERMRWELRALQQQLQITFVYVTHDQAEALAMSDWVAVMHQGQVEQWGTPTEIYYHPSSVFMASFIGTANLQQASVLKKDGQMITVALGQYQFTLRHPAFSVHDQVMLCLRPECLSLNGRPQNTLCVNMSGTIIRKAFLGHLMRYWIGIEGQEWIVDQVDPGQYQMDFAGEVTLSFDPSRIQILPGS